MSFFAKWAAREAARRAASHSTAARLILIVGLTPIFLIIAIGLMAAVFVVVVAGAAGSSSCGTPVSGTPVSGGGWVTVGATVDPTFTNQAYQQFYNQGFSYAELGATPGYRNYIKGALARDLGYAGDYQGLPPGFALMIRAIGDNGPGVRILKADIGAGQNNDPQVHYAIDLHPAIAQALGVSPTTFRGDVEVRTADSSGTTGVAVPVSTSVTTGGALDGSSASSYVDGLGSNRAGFAVVDANGQVLAAHNENMQVAGASITKAMLLVAFLEHNSPSGAAAGHLTAMIEQSSNSDANWVFSQVGAGAVRRVAGQAGMTAFQLDTSDPAYVLGQSAVTALDQARLFSKIDQLMPAGQRQFGIGLLAHLSSADQWGILSAGVGVTASKAGWKPEANGWVVNQAGQAQANGGTVGIAVVSQGNADQIAGEKVMETVARDVLGSASGPSGPCVDGPTVPGSVATIGPGGVATVPADAPAAVQAMLAAGNKIINSPYSWGGGHCVQAAAGPSGLGACPGLQENGGPGYDCSGSVEDLLTNGGGQAAIMATGYPASGTLETAGLPGPGQWVTVYASGPHTFIVVAGLLMDTAHFAPVQPTTPATGPRWQPLSALASQLGDGNGWVARHPPGF